MIRKVFLAFLVFGAVGCVGDLDLTDPGSVADTYRLRLLNGERLPAVLIEVTPTFFVEITAGSVTLNEDLTCSVSLTLRETLDGIVSTATDTDACAYTLDSGSITLAVSDPLDPSTLSGSITDSSITITDEGVVLVFRKFDKVTGG